MIKKSFAAITIQQFVCLIVFTILILALVICSNDKTVKSVEITEQGKTTVPKSVKPAQINEPVSEPSEKMISGSFMLRNKRIGLVLRPKGAEDADGVSMVLYPEQNWKCLSWKFEHVKKQGYRIINHFTNKTFHPKSEKDDTPKVVVQVTPDTTPDQYWKFTSIGDGLYRIENVVNGLALTPMAVDEGVNTPIGLAPWHNTDDQKWELLEKPATFSM